MKSWYNYLFLIVLIFIGGSSFAQSRHKLHIPASEGDLTAIKKIINNNPDKVDRRDIIKQTPLMYAVEGGSLEVVKYLVGKGADVNAMSSKKGRGTPLIYATATHQVEIVKYLLEKNANVNLPNSSQNETALFWAVATGHAGLVKLLLKNGANQKIVNKSGENVINIAEKLRKEDILKILFNGT